jgi:hypothetical protein
MEPAIAVTALITSISSIVIAVHHGTIMQRLVQANSIPYLQGGFSDMTPEGELVLSLDLYNRGVGPAHEQSLRVTVDGRHVRTLAEMITATLGPDRGAAAVETLEKNWMKNRVPKRFIPAADYQFVFRLIRTPENAEYWDLLQTSQKKWNVEYCYCSVFDDCWRVPAKWVDPVEVDECTRDESSEFVP